MTPREKEFKKLLTLFKIQYFWAGVSAGALGSLVFRIFLDWILK